VALLVIHLGASAGAETPAERAKQHNLVAKRLFSLGLFREAAEEYRQAYQEVSAPEFLLNLAQCYKRMASADHIERAIFYFKGYLNNRPETPLRRDIEGEIQKLERELALLRQPPPPFYKRWWFWTAVGAAVVGATVGTVVALRPEDMRPVEGRAANFDVP
jgi:tetratricopeptide (TPR) repeat protein